MVEHDYYTSESCDCTKDGYCNVCDGGLAICRVCGLTEGSLTTECPGYQCWREKNKDVYEGMIDFRNGEWVTQVTVHMKHCYPDKYRA